MATTLARSLRGAVGYKTGPGPDSWTYKSEDKSAFFLVLEGKKS